MSAIVWKSFRSVAVVAFLVAGCGGQEPIPVNLETAAGPCADGAPFLTEGMQMVMREGHVTVEPKEGQVQAFYGWMAGSADSLGEEQSPCLGCH